MHKHIVGRDGRTVEPKSVNGVEVDFQGYSFCFEGLLHIACRRYVEKHTVDSDSGSGGEFGAEVVNDSRSLRFAILHDADSRSVELLGSLKPVTGVGPDKLRRQGQRDRRRIR